MSFVQIHKWYTLSYLRGLLLLLKIMPLSESWFGNEDLGHLDGGDVYDKIKKKAKGIIL